MGFLDDINPFSSENKRTWGRGIVGVGTLGQSELWNSVTGGSIWGDGGGNQGSSMADQQANNDARIASYLEAGKKRGESIYGQSGDVTSGQAQDILKRRQEAVDKEGPQADNLRRARNRQIRIARAAGASQGEQDQISRNAEVDIGNAEYNRYQNDMQKYQNTVSNILRGQQGMEFGYGNLGAGGAYVQPPQSGGGILGGSGTVICTEMHRRGYMNDKIYKKDQEYGLIMLNNNPDIYIGYRILADPVVSLMQRSSIFAWAVSIPGMCWARNMAGDSNTIGRLINKYGEKLCGFIGRAYGRVQETKNKKIKKNQSFAG